MTIRPRSSPPLRPGFLVAVVLLAVGSGGCNYFRNLGSGTHMYSAQEHSQASHETRVMIVEVTTDAQGQIANIHFRRSSGKEGIDNYVAETIRQGWPQQPSTLTVAQVTFSEGKGFSQPKVLSTSPAAATPPAPAR